MRTHHTKAVCIVNHEAEAIFLLESHNLIKNAECAGHAKHTFGDNEYTTTVLFCKSASTCQHFLAINDIVVTELELIADMQTYTVQQASVCFCIVNDDIVTTYKRVNRGEDTLVTEVKEESSFFLLELSEHLLQFLVQGCLACHHTASHRIRHAPFSCSFTVHAANLRVISQTKVVIQTPCEHFLAVETHMRSEFAFQFWESKIAVRTLAVLTNRSTGRFPNFVKNVLIHTIYL